MKRYFVVRFSQGSFDINVKLTGIVRANSKQSAVKKAKYEKYGKKPSFGYFVAIEYPASVTLPSA